MRLHTCWKSISRKRPHPTPHTTYLQRETHRHVIEHACWESISRKRHAPWSRSMAAISSCPVRVGVCWSDGRGECEKQLAAATQTYMHPYSYRQTDRDTHTHRKRGTKKDVPRRTASASGVVPQRLRLFTSAFCVCICVLVVLVLVACGRVKRRTNHTDTSIETHTQTHTFKSCTIARAASACPCMMAQCRGVLSCPSKASAGHSRP